MCIRDRYAGVLADRLDRKRMVVAVDLARALVLVFFTVALVGGPVHVGLVLAVMFLLGTAETFADTASPTLLPMVVDKADLGIANARLSACLLYTSPRPRDRTRSRMPSSA